MWQRIWELIQFMKPFFSPSPPLSFFGTGYRRTLQNLQILEVLNQIWITVSGRTGARGSKSGGGISLHRDGEKKGILNQSQKSSLIHTALTMSISHPCLVSFSVSSILHQCELHICRSQNFLWLVLHESNALDFGRVIHSSCSSMLERLYCVGDLHCMVQNLCY